MDILPLSVHTPQRAPFPIPILYPLTEQQESPSLYLGQYPDPIYTDDPYLYLYKIHMLKSYVQGDGVRSETFKELMRL